MPDSVSDHELNATPSPKPPNTLPPTVDSMKEDVPERQSEEATSEGMSSSAE